MTLFFLTPPQIVVPSFPCGSKKTSIDVLNDLYTLLRGKGLNLLSSHWRRPYKTCSYVIRIVFSLLMSPSSGGLGRPPAVRQKLARTPWGRGLTKNQKEWQKRSSLYYTGCLVLDYPFTFNAKLSFHKCLSKNATFRHSLIYQDTAFCIVCFI